MKLSYLAMLAFAMLIHQSKADDNFAAAIEISPGETAGVIDSQTDNDYFSFTIPSSQYVSIAMKSSQVGLPAITLNLDFYNSLESRLTYVNLSDDANISDILPAGKYYIRLKSGSTTVGTGGYRILLNTQSSATPLEPMTQVGALDVHNDQDFYKFTVAKPGLVAIRTRAANSSTAAIYLNMELFNSQGSRVSYSFNDTICKIGENLNPGDYYVRIKTGGRAPETGNYSIKLITPDAAAAIRNGTHNGRFNVPGDQNYYKFVVEGAVTKSVGLTSTGPTILFAELFTNNGSRISYSFPYSGIFNIREDLAPGTYYLALTGSDSGAGSFGDYSFTLTGASAPVPTPEIAVSRNRVNIPDNSISPTTAAGTDFGGLKIGRAGVARTFTIKNNGPATLNISRTFLSGSSKSSFKIVRAPASVVRAGQSTTFALSFTPRSKGTRIATLNLNNNDSNEDPFNFRITGKGL